MKRARPPVYVEKGATLSPHGGQRYALWRRWGWGRVVVFVMLNPSTADADDDDPTIRRCRAYALAWGYDGFIVVNLGAYRTKSPRAFRNIARTIVQAARDAVAVVCAWGDNARHHRERRDAVVALLRGAGCALFALGTTKIGEPLHPLMQRGDLKPQPWAP